LVGCPAGGGDALPRLLSQLPDGLPAPCFLLMHRASDANDHVTAAEFEQRARDAHREADLGREFLLRVARQSTKPSS
jgi:chemotaxis response regulator CheB